MLRASYGNAGAVAPEGESWAAASVDAERWPHVAKLCRIHAEFVGQYGAPAIRLAC